MPFAASTTALVPFRAAPAVASLNTLNTTVLSAPLSSSARQNKAAAMDAHGTGLVRRERKEVPLASQEPTKGLVQYALYVFFFFPLFPPSYAYMSPSCTAHC